MESKLSEQEHKEILNLIENIGEYIDKARKLKINVIEKIEKNMENGIEPTQRQVFQLNSLVDECNYKIRLLQKGE